MKTSRILCGAFGMLALASCSNDEMLDVNRSNDEIAFNVVANNASRAADVFCNNNLPGEFYVWASAHEGETRKDYILGDHIMNTATGNDAAKWENQTAIRFWPQDGSTLDFFAHVNAGTAFNWNGGAPTIVNFTVPTNVTEQVDLLYAVKTGQSKEVDETTKNAVALNFRHALSQIVFQAKNTNPKLYVEISGVDIVHLGNMNTFTYPTNNTDNNIEDDDHDGSLSDLINYDGSWGTWGGLTGGTTTYGVTFDTVKLDGKVETAVSLTNNAAETEFNTNAMLLLPQTTTAWNPDTENYVVDGNTITIETTGTYFLVNCRIYNIAGSEFNEATDKRIWPKSGETFDHAKVAIPVSVNWEQGKKYIYTFVFGEGAGYPELVPVTFTITVDDFVDGGNTDINVAPNA